MKLPGTPNLRRNSHKPYQPESVQRSERCCRAKGPSGLDSKPRSPGTQLSNGTIKGTLTGRVLNCLPILIVIIILCADQMACIWPNGFQSSTVIVMGDMVYGPFGLTVMSVLHERIKVLHFIYYLSIAIQIYLVYQPFL